MAKKTKKSYFDMDEVLSTIGNVLLAVLCISLVFPVFIKNIHAGYQYIIICIVVMLISILGTFLNFRNARPALKILPFLAFNDIVIYFILFIANIIKINNTNSFSEVLKIFQFDIYLQDDTLRTIFIISLVLFVLSFFISLKRSDIFLSILFSMEGIVVSLFFIWKFTTKTSYGRIILSISLLISLIWIFICLYSNVVTKGFRRNMSFYSLFVSLFIIIFNAYFANNGTKGLNAFFKVPTQITDDIVRKMYPWWLAILLTVLCIAFGTFLAFVADDGVEDDVRGYADAKFFYGAAALVLLTKVILSNYFSYSVLLYVLVLFVLYLDIRKDISRINEKDKENRYYDLEDFIFKTGRLIYLTVCGVFIILISKNMLYLTLVTTIIIMYMLFRLARNFVKKELLEEDIPTVLHGLPKAYHFTIILLAALLTATIVFYSCFSISHLILLCILIITTMFIFLTLKRKLPKNIKLPELNTAKWGLVFFSVVICIVLASSSGAKVVREYNNADKITEIGISVNKKTSIKEIEYKWNNSIIFNEYQSLVADNKSTGVKQKREKIKKKVSNTTLKIPVEGEQLTIWITDSNGVKTTKTLWYPIWFDTKY